jgi:poly(hydroxyalkanoate) depolymerase family esterase
MPRLLRRWIKKARIRLPLLSGSSETARSRWLVARFKDSLSGGLFARVRRLELGYRLYLPSGSSRRDSLPLIVMLHGCQQNPLSFAEGTRMNALAEERRCAVLYPEQSVHSNPLRCWNWFDSAALLGEGDAGLIARLIDQVTERRPIDPRRVYVVGMSAGAAMACVLAVRHSRLFAACASHSGVMYGAARSPSQALTVMRSGPSLADVEQARRLWLEVRESALTVPTLVIHGERDTKVNPVNADRIIEQLQARSEVTDPSAGVLQACDELCIDDGGRSSRQRDYTRQGQIVVRRVLVEGLGHAWSGGDTRHEFNDAEGPDASRLILDFVMQYQRETVKVQR